MKHSIYLSGLPVGKFLLIFENFPSVNLNKGFLNGNRAFPTFEDVKERKTTALLAIKVDYDDEEIDFEEIISAFCKELENGLEDSCEVPYIKKLIAYDDIYFGIIAKSFIDEHNYKSLGISIEKMCNFFPYKD
ncbi:MAG: peptide-methionine (S)-S-oxide reductase [Bacilli bacterium]|nr:peptide-methionine (S)-S-oxide reductase [Bacilli bacterium]MDY6430383.1 peptide-methionine (S)-S-oxide reductase [Bacilli bacterium]